MVFGCDDSVAGELGFWLSEGWMLSKNGREVKVRV